MLKKLIIKQFVIIHELELDFQSGLTILTGETGAGKSILLDALGLILGDKANPESIRQGSEESFIEGTFSISPSDIVTDFLRTENLIQSATDTLTIRRVIKRSGDEDISMNGNPIPYPTLQEIGAYLAEIHGQFANQNLTNQKKQLTWLDMSGNFPQEYFDNVYTAFHEVKRLDTELREEKAFLSEHKRDWRKIETIVTRFDKLGMAEGFIEETEAEYQKLLTAKETSEAFQGILSQLMAGNGVVVALSTANKTLAKQNHIERDKVQKLEKLLENCLNDARESVAEIARLSPEYEIDIGPLQRLETILLELRNIASENKVPYENLYPYYDELATKLKRIKGGKDKIAELEDMLKRAKSEYRHHAHILTEKRIEAGQTLSQTITEECAPLKLVGAEFDVMVEEKVDIPWTERGFNLVTYIARMNPGMPFSPIAETASGGELARMMLALKVVLQEVQKTPTLVFDEVDTGIGGAAAASVGQRLAELAEDTQVLVITHSPQVAARGHQHLHISKSTDGVTTTSSVNALSDNDRIDEISRMLAGDTLTDESRAAAQSLITEAEKARGNI